MIQLENALFRKGAAVVLRNVNLALEPGQHWAITGPTGAGKSLLLDALAGRFLAQSGRVKFFDDDAGKQPLTREQHKARTALVTFRAASHAFDYGRFFYQQRYHAGLEESLDLYTFLQLNEQQVIDSQAILARFGLLPFLSLPFIKLSNGQTRKVLIAKALLHKPALLLLDDPFVGLDAAMRQNLAEWLDELMLSGTQLVLIAPPEALPKRITHMAELTDGQVISGLLQVNRISVPAKPDSDETTLPTPPNWQTPPMIPLPAEVPIGSYDIEIKLKPTAAPLGHLLLAVA